MLRLLLISLLFVGSLASVIAQQSKIDSLGEVIDNIPASDTAWHKPTIDLLYEVLFIDYEKSNQILDKLYKKSTEINFDRGMFSYFYMKAKLGYLHGEYHLADSCVNISLDMALKNSNLGTKLPDIYGDLGLIKYAVSSYDSSLYFFRLGEKKAIELSQFRVLAKIRSNMMRLLLVMGNYEEAIKEGEKSVQYYAGIEGKTSENYFNLAITYNSMGFIYANWSKPEEAVQTYSKALDALSMSNHPQSDGLKAAILTNIGGLYTTMEELRKSLYYHQKAYKLYLVENRKPKLALCLFNIAENYHLTYIEEKEKGSDEDELNNLLTKAADTARLASDLYASLNDSSNIADSYILLGHIAKDKMKYDSAEIYYINAYDFFKRKESFKSYVNKALASLYFEQKKYMLAKQYITESIEKMDTSNYRLAADNFKSLMAINKELGESEEMYNNFQLFITYQDSFLNEKSLEAVREFEVKYQTAEKDRQLAEQEAQLAQEKLARQRTLLIAALVGGVLLAGIIVAFFVIRARTRQRRAEAALRAKIESDLQRAELDLEDLVSVQSELRQYQEELNTTAENFRNMYTQLQKEEKPTFDIDVRKYRELPDFPQIEAIIKMTNEFTKRVGEQVERNKDVVGRLQSQRLNLKEAEGWQRFSTAFHEKFPGVLKSIEDQFGKLSKQQKALFMLIYLKTEREEIKQALEIWEEGAMKKARQRLSKKLNIDSANKLDQWIHDFRDQQSEK